ncbi:hypothetical protein VKT23_019446 [Stygiomarasmius scandens]|uniref:Uncharacterized protein n=1 Tax=Marasmiellus scandens TaxID=2682957 RepID=A0ABR1IP74_9AGAR
MFLPLRYSYSQITGIPIPADNVLGKRLVNALKSFDEHYVDFKNFHQGLSKTVGEETLAEWDEMVKLWEEDRDEFCPYDSNAGGDEGAHFKKMELKLAHEEHSRLLSGLPGYPSSLCVFLVEGIMLQEIQRSIELFITINGHMSPTQELELQKRRTSLLKRIIHFHSLQRLLMLRLVDVLSEADWQHVERPDHDQPEKIKLILPSDCGTRAARIRACVGDLPEVEERLCVAEVEDALEGVRDGLRARTATSRFKIQNVTGQVGSTRASGILRQIDIRIHTRKIRYRVARDALLRLRGHGEWEEVLWELKDADIRGLSERSLTREEIEAREQLQKRVTHELNLGDEDFYFEEEGIYNRIEGESKHVLSWIWWDQRELAEKDENDPEYIDGECPCTNTPAVYIYQQHPDYVY